MAVLCSMCLLMFPIYHILGSERNGLCGWKSHYWCTFPQGDNSTSPQCVPKQHVLWGWVCKTKSKLCGHEMLWVHVWCGSQGNLGQEESTHNTKISLVTSIFIAKPEVQNLSVRQQFHIFIRTLCSIFCNAVWLKFFDHTDFNPFTWKSSFHWLIRFWNVHHYLPCLNKWNLWWNQVP